MVRADSGAPHRGPGGGAAAPGDRRARGRASPLGTNGVRLGAGIYHALAAAGLPPDGVVLAAQALIAYVAAALAMATNAGTRDARWHQVSRSMEGPPRAVMPVVRSEEQFGYGLRLLLHGIAVEAGVG